MADLDGFLKYGAGTVADIKDKASKVDSIRRAKSQPDLVSIQPTLTKGQVLFVPEVQDNGTPASCYDCSAYNYGRSCQIIGKQVRIRKFIYGQPDKPIEYWPCCGAQAYGTPNYGPEKFAEYLNNPSDLSLLWINAPEVGQDHGGANCGGQNGGDDCDYFMVDGPDKRSFDRGFCRILQAEVGNKEKCCVWIDDDRIEWQEAQAILKKLDGEN